MRPDYCPTRPRCFSSATAKSLQSCPTLCDPINGSPPGSPILGILQARTLEWVAISFSNAWKWKVKVKSLSRVWPSVTPWTTAFQAPPSMGFSRQEHWSGVPLPSPALAQSLLSPRGWHVTQGPRSVPRKSGLFPKKRGPPSQPCMGAPQPQCHLVWYTDTIGFLLSFLLLQCFLTQWTHYVFYYSFDSSSLFQQSLGQSVCVKAPLFRYIFHLAIHNIYLGKKYNSKIIHVAWVINVKCIFKVLKKIVWISKKELQKGTTSHKSGWLSLKSTQIGLPWWSSGWESACQCKGHGFDPCSGKIPHAMEQLCDRVPQLVSLCSRAREPQPLSPRTLEPEVCNKRSHCSEKHAHHKWRVACDFHK